MKLENAVPRRFGQDHRLTRIQPETRFQFSELKQVMARLYALKNKSLLIFSLTAWCSSVLYSSFALPVLQIAYALQL